MRAAHVMIISSRPEQCGELISRLSQAGYDVVGTADSIHEASRLSASTPADIAIVDACDDIEQACQIGPGLHDQNRMALVYLTDGDGPENQLLCQTSADGLITRSMDQKEIATVLDMSRTRHACELAMRVNEARFRHLADSTSALIWISDITGECTWFNRGWLDFTGMPLSQQLGDGWTAAVHEEDLQRVISDYRDAFERRQPFRLEYRLRRHDGVYRYVRDEGCPCTDQKGQFSGYVGCGMDIHELRQAHQELSESERKLRAILEASPDLVFVLDSDGRYENVFTAQPEHLHTSADRLKGKRLADLWPAEVADKLQQRIDRALQTRQRQECEYSLDIKGQTRHFDAAISPFETTRGPRVLWVVRDVTDMVNMWQARQESEQRVERLIEASEDLVVMHDRDGRYLYFSGPKGYHVSAHDVLGRTPADLLEPELAREIMDQIEEVFRTGNVVSREFHVRWKGMDLWTSDIAYPVRNAAGDITAVGKICRNITPKKNVEIRLETERRVRDLVLDSISDLVVFTGVDHLIHWANAPAERYSGVGPGDLVGKGCYQVWQNREEACPDCPVDRMYETGQTVQNQMTTPDGCVWSVTTCPVWDERGGLMAAIQVGRDITVQARAQQQQRQIEAKDRKLEKMRSLANLAGGVAHDFNNLLSVMLGNAELALRDLGLDNPTSELIKEIHKACRRASELSNRMLAYSGRGRFIVQPGDLNDLIRRAIATRDEPILDPHELHCDLAPSLPSITVDTDQIVEAVRELIDNAVEAIGESAGTIRLSTGLTHLDSDALDKTVLNENLSPGEFVYVEVGDSGCGMDESARSQLFDPFYSTKFTGRGLGLPAVLGIVRGHNGAVSVESRPGHGTAIRLMFPAQPSDASARAASPDVDTLQTDQRAVLIIDDEPAVLSVTSKMIRDTYMPLTAETFSAGLDMLNQLTDRNLCAVLLDLSASPSDLAEAISSIRATRPHVPIVMMSGYAPNQIDIEKISNIHFLAKPFSREQLLDILQRVCGR